MPGHLPLTDGASKSSRYLTDCTVAVCFEDDGEQRHAHDRTVTAVQRQCGQCQQRFVGISAYSSSVTKSTDELPAPGYSACMTSNHPFRARSTPASPKRAGGRPFWWATLAWIVASIAYSTVAFANLPMASWLPESPQTVMETRTAPAVLGVVETIRKFEAVGVLPAGYEFTVRLRDGSTRVSSDASAARWRVGDSIMLIGSVKPLI